MCYIDSIGSSIKKPWCLQLLEKRLEDGQAQGELGVLLDGFPRTRRQAQMLALIADTQLAVNLSLRPEVSWNAAALQKQAGQFAKCHLCTEQIKVRQIFQD